jgi:hypothetical protein
MEILGSTALAYDLLKSKSAEEGTTEFRRLQAEVESGTQTMIVMMNSGLRRLAELTGGYLSALEVKTEGSTSLAAAGITPPSIDVNDLFEKARVKAVTGLLDATKHLQSPEQINAALGTIAAAREAIERQFNMQVDLSKQLRRVAIIGVLLVGIGGLCEFADLVLMPEAAPVSDASKVARR